MEKRNLRENLFFEFKDSFNVRNMDFHVSFSPYRIYIASGICLFHEDVFFGKNIINLDKQILIYSKNCKKTADFAVRKVRN